MGFLPIPSLHPDQPVWFTPASAALHDPNGLLAWGGDLSPARLQAAYRQGRIAGLAEFCRPDNGFRHGAAGGEYHGTCMPGDEAFRAAWAEGHRGFELRSTIAEAKRRLPKIAHDLDLAQRDMTVLENEVLGSSRSEGLSMNADVERLQRRIAKLRAERVEWQRKLESATLQLQEYERRHGGI